MLTSSDVWAKRFGTMALINALIATGWLIFPLFIDTRITRTIAGGSAGTWGYLGFLGIVLVGFGGFVGFAFLYFLIPKTTGGQVNRILAWAHLVLMEIGTLAITAIFGVVGYIGGTSILAGEAAKVHERIVWAVELYPGAPPYLSPAAISLGLAGLGVLLGIIGLFLAYMKKS